MTQSIVNAAPMQVMLGVDDVSTRPLVPVPEVLPTHLVKVYSYAETGPTDPQLVVGDALTQMYGANSLDERMSYATHQTPLINTLNTRANSMMFERVVPTDAPPPANVRLYLDVLSTMIDDYKRNADGSYVVDELGYPVSTGTQIQGFKVKWVSAYIETDADGNSLFAQGTQMPGDQTDTTTSTQSLRYPIFDFAYPHQGARGNRNGVRLFAPTEASSTAINTTSLVKDFVYPFRISLVEKSVSTGTPVIQPTNSGTQYIDVCLKPGTISSIDDSELFITRKFPSSYQTLNDPSGLPNSYGPIGKFAVYQGNVDSLINQFYTAEVPHIVAGLSDFDGTTGEQYRFNLISGVSSGGVPYHSFTLNTDDANAQRLTENSVLYVQGGGDGTMSEDLFAGLVSDRVTGYADPLSYLQNDARYPEGYLYDTGFPLATKYDLISFIALRKDTMVFLCTHDTQGVQLTADEESSLAIALRTRLQQYPESDYFGTAMFRGCVFGRSGTMINNNYPNALPLVIDFADKAASFMGAGNGKWKPGAGFDEVGANKVTLFSAVNVTYTPATVRNKDWDNGLVWVEDFSRRELYWPAFHTAYDNDTSVLTSIVTAMAAVEIEKIMLRVTRSFSGNSKLTNEQFKSRVEKAVTDECQDKFDGRYVIQPQVYYTDADIARGYSYGLRTLLYANNMKTVATCSIEAHRMSDLTTNGS